MVELIQFNQLTTSLKSMESINSDERYFEGLLTVQMKDKQGEVTIVDELYKVLPIWMDRGAPISDTHTNRIIGKGINYSKTIVKDEHGESFPAIKITGKIYKNYELDNVIWDKIRNKEYRGLSFGGATRSNRTPMRMKDGSMAYALSNLEHYEVAVCKDPAVPLAVITDFNPIAKASFNSEVRDDGKMVIRCTDMGCYVEKSEEVEKVERSKPFSQFGSDLKVGEKTPAEITPNTKFFGADGKSYKTPELAAKAPPRKRRNVSAERKARADYKAQAGVSIGDRLAMRNNADLNESQTFQEKVDALVREGKSEESAKKIVGSFVHKELLIKAGYQTEAGNTQLGGQASTEDDKEKREKEDEEKEDDEVERRDHSDAGGDIHSMYNQNVGREASSGRKLKGDTTVNQTGGIRENSAGTYIQGSGKTNDINPVQKKPERNEELLISNIKVVRNINNSLEKHSQIQQLKKIKDGLLPKSPRKYTEDDEDDEIASRELGNNNQWQAHRFDSNTPNVYGNRLQDRISSHDYTHTGKEIPYKDYTVGGSRFTHSDDTSRTATSLRRQLQKIKGVISADRKIMKDALDPNAKPQDDLLGNPNTALPKNTRVGQKPPKVRVTRDTEQDYGTFEQLGNPFEGSTTRQTARGIARERANIPDTGIKGSKRRVKPSLNDDSKDRYRGDTIKTMIHPPNKN